MPKNTSFLLKDRKNRRSAPRPPCPQRLGAPPPDPQISHDEILATRLTATLSYPSSYLILLHCSSWRNYSCKNIG